MTSKMSDLITFKPILRRKCRIKSPSTDPEKPAFLDVPLNNNHFVRKRMMNDWYLRSLYEYKYSLSSFFLTLTYDEQSVPRMPDGKLGFCPQDIVKFFKNLRNRLHSKTDHFLEFRYFQVSEYGKTTHRPHYHVVVFFPYTTVLHPFFRQIVKSAWQHGFADIAHPRSNAVLTYVSKYVTKDMYSNPSLKSSLDDDMSCHDEHRLIRLTDGELSQTKNKVVAFKESPSTVTLHNFHRCSKGFGKALIDHLTEEDWKRGYIFLGDGVRVFPYAIPKYIVDKVCRKTLFWKDSEGNIKSQTSPTEFGKQVFEWRIQHNHDYLILRCKELCNPVTISSLEKQGCFYNTNFLDLTKAWEHCSFKLIYPDWTPSQALYQYLRNYRNHISISKLPAFVHVGNQVFSRDSYFFTSDYGEVGQIRKTHLDSDQDIIYYYENLLETPHFSPGSSVSYDQFLYNHDFIGFEVLLNEINEVEFFIDSRQQRYQERQEYYKLMKKLNSNSSY